MKTYELEIDGEYRIDEEGIGLTREQWDEEFKKFFKTISQKYKDFKLEYFVFMLKNDSTKIQIITNFRFTPEDNWDMSDVFDATVDFNGELYGNSESVGRLLGGGCGHEDVYEVEDYMLHSEMPDIYHDKYVLGE